MLLGTLATTTLGNALVVKGVFVMPLHSLTNFEIQKYYQNEPKFNGVNSRNNLSKIKDK